MIIALPLIMATRSASALSALPAASQCRVAVCGAGVAGALTARRLAEAGMSVTCFEAGRGPGGRTSSRRTDLGHFLRFLQWHTSEVARGRALPRRLHWARRPP